MKTAIIILNYNDYETTEKYINVIKEYNCLDVILAIDNNSPLDDYTKLKKLEASKIEVIKAEKNGGYAYGNNYGIRYLEDKYGKDYFDTYIISNPDIFVEEEVIKKCISKLHSSNKIGMVAPRMYYENGVARRSAWKKRTYKIDIANSTRITELFLRPLMKMGEYSKKDYENDVLKVFTLAGSFFLIKAKIFDEIGMFDENTFLFFEEDIIGSKLEEKGYEVLSLNDIRFIHYDSRTIGKLMNMFKKQKILFQSRKYYHKMYNNVNGFKLAVFDALYGIRCFELLIEVSLLKLIKKIKKK